MTEEKKNLMSKIKKVGAGGSLTVMLIGLIVEGNAQYKGLKQEIASNHEEIAVIKTINTYQDKTSESILRNQNIIINDIKLLLRK